MTDSRAERRSAGTEIMLDVLLRWAWIRRRTPARDIADFDGGQPLRVVGFTQSIGGTVKVSVGKGKQVARLRQGYLRFAAGEPPLWKDARGGRSATLRAPFRLKPAGGKVRLAPKFERYELVTGAGTYDLAVPKKDGELVRHAFGAGRGGASVERRVSPTRARVLASRHRPSPRGRPRASATVGLVECVT
ncbi:hypothetical protein ACFU53_34470 [Streptomyces sp. NPDC057474]|uniref:hypothetical protein n=1 Tax=Streptomyces sp. NPDC057474 TaxID=3346144 RepID=UPI00369FD831